MNYVIKNAFYDNVEKVSKILDKLEDENMIKYVEEIKKRIEAAEKNKKTV